jgi:hypothetical protein
MAKMLAWTCLIIGILIVISSVLHAVILFAGGDHSTTSIALRVGARSFALALGVVLIIFGRRRLQWIREEAAYDKAVGGRPHDDFADFEEHGIDDDPRV